MSGGPEFVAREHHNYASLKQLQRMSASSIPSYAILLSPSRLRIQVVAPARVPSRVQLPPSQSTCLNPLTDSAMGKSGKPGYYAVARGRVPGIYSSWDECQAQTAGFAGNKHQKFSPLEQARQYLSQHGVSAAVPPPSAAAASAVASSSTTPNLQTASSKRARTHRAKPYARVQSPLSSAAGNTAKPRNAQWAALTKEIIADESGWDVAYSDDACKGNGKVGAIAGIGVWWAENDPSPDEVHPPCLIRGSKSTATLSSSDSSVSDMIPIEDEPIKSRRLSLRTISIALGRFRINWNGARNGDFKEDRVISIDTTTAAVAELLSPLASGAEGSARKIAEYGTKALAESLPELLRTLQAIASVHPFIGLAVGAFRVAIGLDLKRRGNDKKINLLFVEMRDMMTALLKLDDIDDPGCIGATGKTIQEKLQRHPDLCQQLQQYIKRFEKRRADMQFTIAVHLGMSIDAANRQIGVLHEKMDRALTYLQSCVSPEERELVTFIKRKGGRDVILKDDRLLLELAQRRSASIYQDSGGRWAGRQDSLDLDELQAALSEDPAISITRNSDAFERKFEMQERELLRIQEIVHEENAHVIKSISSGPHDKIHDNNLHNIWREMRWRGNVKARYFVLAVNDYCLEKLDRLNRNEQTFTDCDRPTRITEQDEWTLEYISVTRLQAIIEAFDDDASGFITISEVNTFTASKPPDWSLLHWMAYWAVGWQMTMTWYVVDIDHILDKMLAIRSHVLPANRRSVERYLDQLVTGPGRIEKYLFPLLYLLLQRDYEIMRLATKVVIHKDELWDSSDTLNYVFRAVEDRYINLENLFKQQNLDPAQQFKVFAAELFRYRHDPTPLWSIERLRETHYPELHYNDAEEDQFVDPYRLLNHPIEESAVNPLASPQYVETWPDRRATGSIKAILGQWSGFLGDAAMFPSEPMLTLHVHATHTSSNGAQFEAKGTLANGTTYKLTRAKAIGEGEEAVYTFSMQYAARYWPKNFRGRLSDSGRELRGTWTCPGDSSRGTFLFRRLPPELMRFWPLPVNRDIAQKKARALWWFACLAVHGQLRQRTTSLPFLIERQEVRQRCLKFIRARDGQRMLDENELQSLAHCFRSMTPGISCVNCHDHIYGSRIMCLDCGIRTTVDLCDKPSCREATVGPDRRDGLVSPHLPSHRILKVRRVIHRHREFGKTYGAPQAALIRAEEALANADEVVVAHTPTGHGRSLSARIRTEALVARELSCIGCKTRVSRPCWYCNECDDECFVCMECIDSRSSFSSGHKRMHGIVRVAWPREEATKSADMEWSHSRIDVLETKIDTFQQESATRFDALDGRLSVLETR
ncbi:hypothetical protein PYCCODRAFT_1472108 [Trametes coccinea BRFM310]|uniref:Ribonuclease H n=1 Tax=Trametes coccinea (strain BRFM310) TaxID=1353009 RepID=A0A1Y2I7F2_TRAC3|nr:hypothetical protein PYCCODRAFT_1472108 [Trametes coccinea BRFM310]